MKLLLGILIASSFFLTSCGVIEDILGGEDEPEVSQETAETPEATAGAEGTTEAAETPEATPAEASASAENDIP